VSTDPFAPAQLGPLTLRNRVIKAATFEGRSRKNLVTDELIEFHRAMAAGGVGMTTLAFCAISRDARSAPGEIVVGPDAAPGLARLAEAVHAQGAAVSAQLGHAGAVAAGTGYPGLAPSRFFSKLARRRTRAVDANDIARITADFAVAARTVVDAGFDAVELHFGHGYLVSEFLSPKLNRRRDDWGGPIVNRARFARDVALGVRDAVGRDVAVIAKLNMVDGVRRGLMVDESVEVGRLLEADGALDALELTGGSSLEAPMYLFKGPAPIKEMAATMPRSTRVVFKLVARRIMASSPYEEAYFLPLAAKFRAALRMPLILLGGISNRTTINRAMTAGFDFVAMGRALLREPDLVSRYAQDAATEATCIHCNKCVPSIYSRTRCVLDSP